MNTKKEIRQQILTGERALFQGKGLQIYKADQNVKLYRLEAAAVKSKKKRNLLFALLLLMSLVPGLVLSSVWVSRAEAETKLSVAMQVGSNKVDKNTIIMKKGSSKKIKLSIVPDQSGITTEYRSDRQEIVSVSRTGMLKAKKAGTAKITVAVSGDNVRTAKKWFKVKVVRQSDSDTKEDIPVTLTVNGQKFKAVFYNNKTAAALLDQMPMTLAMKELNGNEKYYFFGTKLPTDQTSPGKITAGDIMLYGSDCLVTFYKSHNTSYSYTPVGKIEDASGFADAAGSGAVTITFEKG